MALFDFRDAADSMEDLLDRERTAILNGRFDVLERLMSEKERLAGRLSRNRAAFHDLDRIKAKAERNSTLLEAMRSGLMDARARLLALRQKPEALQTYDSAGRRTPIGGNGSGNRLS